MQINEPGVIWIRNNEYLTGPDMVNPQIWCIEAVGGIEGQKDDVHRWLNSENSVGVDGVSHSIRHSQRKAVGSQKPAHEDFQSWGILFGCI